MSPFIKADVLLVLNFRRKIKRGRKRETKLVFCGLPSLLETACSCKIAQSAAHSSVEDYNHSNTWSI